MQCAWHNIESLIHSLTHWGGKLHFSYSWPGAHLKAWLQYTVPQGALTTMCMWCLSHGIKDSEQMVKFTCMYPKTMRIEIWYAYWWINIFLHTVCWQSNVNHSASSLKISSAHTNTVASVSRCTNSLKYQALNLQSKNRKSLQEFHKV